LVRSISDKKFHAGYAAFGSILMIIWYLYLTGSITSTLGKSFLLGLVSFVYVSIFFKRRSTTSDDSMADEPEGGDHMPY